MAWRDLFPAHPAADVFPMMGAAELEELGRDVQENGLRQPVVLWRDNRAGPGIEEGEAEATLFLVDGRNRLEAMERQGLPVPSFEEDARLRPERRVHEVVDAAAWTSTLRDPSAFRSDRPVPSGRAGGPVAVADPEVLAMSLNVKRRHLSAAQKRRVVETLVRLRPTSSNRAIAREAGTSEGFVRRVVRNTGTSEQVPEMRTVRNTGTSSRPRERARAEILRDPTVTTKDLVERAGVSRTTAQVALREYRAGTAPTTTAAPARTTTPTVVIYGGAHGQATDDGDRIAVQGNFTRAEAVELGRALLAAGGEQSSNGGGS